MIELRSSSVSVDGAAMTGVAIPWGEWADITENGIRFREKFLPNSISAAIRA